MAAGKPYIIYTNWRGLLISIRTNCITFANYTISDTYCVIESDCKNTWAAVKGDIASGRLPLIPTISGRNVFQHFQMKSISLFPSSEFHLSQMFDLLKISSNLAVSGRNVNRNSFAPNAIERLAQCMRNIYFFLKKLEFSSRCENWHRKSETKSRKLRRNPHFPILRNVFIILGPLVNLKMLMERNLLGKYHFRVHDFMRRTMNNPV